MTLDLTPAQIAARAEFWRRGDLDYKRHPGQRQLTAAARACETTETVIHAARGYGKTFDALLDLIEWGIKNTSQRMVFAAPTREDAKKIVSAVMPMIVADAPASHKPLWVATDHLFVLPSSESKLIIEGADDDRGNHLRGPHIHRCVADEAGFWRHCRYVIKSVLLPQLQRVSGRIRIQSTSPESVGHEFVALCEESIRKQAYFRFTVHENPRLTPAKIQHDAEEVSGKKGADVWKDTSVRREFLCEFVTDATRAVIPEFEETRHVVKKLARPEYVDCYEGLDLGLVDLTHCLFGYWDFTRAVLCIEDEICAQYMRTNEFSELAKKKETELWKDVPYREDPSPHNRCPWGRYSDNEAQQLYDLAGYGLSFAPAIKTDKEAAINAVRTLFASDKIEIHARCKNLIHQLRVGTWNERRSDYERLPGAGHLDGIDALVYMARMIDRNRNPIPPKLGWRKETHFSPDTKRSTHPLGQLVRKL